MKAIYEAILVPLDGSPLAEEILRHLRRMILPGNTVFHLVGVLEAWRYSMGAPELPMHDWVDQLRTELQTYLADQKAALVELGYRVETHYHEGDAALTIIDVAKTLDVDLLAMTTHGRSGVRRWALGSVAERVLQEAQQPLLLVRHETSFKNALKQLLVPLDGSTLSEAALEHAMKIAQVTGATIMLLHVVQALDPTNQRLLFHSKAEAESTVHAWCLEGERYLASVGKRLAEQKIPYEIRVCPGDPDRIICATAVDANVDLVVMSTHGRTGFQRWFYGSVANKVLRGLDCPLILVRNVANNTMDLS